MRPESWDKAVVGESDPQGASAQRVLPLLPRQRTAGWRSASGRTRPSHRPVAPTKDRHELLSQTVELAHLTTLAMALAQGRSGLCLVRRRNDRAAGADQARLTCSGRGRRETGRVGSLASHASSRRRRSQGAGALFDDARRLCPPAAGAAGQRAPRPCFRGGHSRGPVPRAGGERRQVFTHRQS